jgi:hypothetical protein
MGLEKLNQMEFVFLEFKLPLLGVFLQLIHQYLKVFRIGSINF